MLVEETSGREEAMESGGIEGCGGGGVKGRVTKMAGPTQFSSDFLSNGNFFDISYPP